MADAKKTIAVVVRASLPGRAREALRGAIGLSLRGDRVVAILAAEQPESDPAFVRHRTMLAEFGHTVTDDLSAADRADVVEVWRDTPAPRTLALRTGAATREVALDDLTPDEVLDLVFEYDVALLR